MMPDTSYDELRADLLRLCGEKATKEFFASFAGLQIRIPIKVRSTSPLAQAIGLEAAIAFAAEYGGCIIFVPTGAQSRAQKLRELLLTGMSCREAALQCGMTDRGARGARQQLEEKGLL